MKGLSSLTNVQRAKVLYDWFSNEIEEFIAYESEVATRIVADKERLKTSLNEGQVFPASTWIALAETAVARIKQYDGRIAHSGVLFSEQLFDGDNSFFAKHCLLQFGLGQKFRGTKFKAAVELLFQ